MHGLAFKAFPVQASPSLSTAISSHLLICLPTRTQSLETIFRNLSARGTFCRTPMYSAAKSGIALVPLRPPCLHRGPRAPAQGLRPKAQLANIAPGPGAATFPSNLPASAQAAPLPSTLVPDPSSQSQPCRGGAASLDSLQPHRLALPGTLRPLITSCPVAWIAACLCYLPQDPESLPEGRIVPDSLLPSPKGMPVASHRSSWLTLSPGQGLGSAMF